MGMTTGAEIEAATPIRDGEFLAILSSSESIQSMMDKLVGYLCKRWEISWCWVFLFDETNQRLTLRAAYGTPTDLVGKASLALGESVSGRALAQRSPIYTTQASREPGFVIFNGLVAGTHDTLLAVPLQRGEERIGVLTLQRPTGIPFSPEEISALRYAAAQMAVALENARALIMLESKARDQKKPLVITEERIFQGTSLNKGVAEGVIRVLTRARASTILKEFRKETVAREAQRSLDQAVELTSRQIQHYQATLGKRLPEAASMLFESHILMLKDDSFIGKIRQHMTGGMSPTKAIATTAREFISFFESSRHDYLREKVGDVEDLALRLLDNIIREDLEEDPVEEAHIIVTAELLPSDILKISQDNIQGIVLVGGGSTAHVTLLVRSLQIPMIQTDAAEVLRIPNGEKVLMDCGAGKIIVQPSAETSADYRQRQIDYERRKRRRDIQEETWTRDGSRIHLLANINLLSELDLALEMKAEGVGLYRTEFPFLMRPALPTEAEQLAVYERMLERMPDKPVVFRTLDAGGDKVLAYFNQANEANPALGLRSTRFTLRYPYIFDQQLRAILRAIQLHQRHDVRLMFPMIGSVEELQAATSRMEACIEQLRVRDPSLPVIRPAVGAMVELPALVYLAQDIAREAAFLSIGTNDFIQYLLAVDRTNSEVANYYMPHHPAVLQGLAQIARAAGEVGRELSVCGEMGGDPRFIPFFIGIGVRHFSLEPSRMARAQRLIAAISIAEAEAYAAELLGTTRIGEIEQIIERAKAEFKEKEEA